MRALLKLALVLVLVAAGWLAWALLVPVRPAEVRFVMLRPGWSTKRIANELQANGVIRSARAMLLYHALAKPRTIKAGEYKFEKSANTLAVHERLVRGDIYVHTVIVPEGFNMFEIATAIESAGLGTRQEFLDEVRKQTRLIHDLDPDARTLEGYLFPDTYKFTRTQSMQDMVTAMVQRFRREARQIGLTSDVHRVVTLAAIIEKETAAPDERPLVASVYHNRLRKGMALDADPSVIYAARLAGRYQGTIYRSDLKFDSPYNTYKYPGLPPGPIANPGRSSLEAAMRPAETNFLFFVSDNNGRHRFASTIDDHSRNVALYRRAVASAAKR